MRRSLAVPLLAACAADGWQTADSAPRPYLAAALRPARWLGPAAADAPGGRAWPADPARSGIGGLRNRRSMFQQSVAAKAFPHSPAQESSR